MSNLKEFVLTDLKLTVPINLKRIKQVGDRTFYMREKVWVDSEYKDGAKTIDIKYDSKRYWKFAKENPKTGKFLALGKKVIFNHEGNWYKIN